MTNPDKSLAGQRIGLFGRGGSGKSPCTVLLAKALARAGYTDLDVRMARHCWTATKQNIHIMPPAHTLAEQSASQLSWAATTVGMASHALRGSG